MEPALGNPQHPFADLRVRLDAAEARILAIVAQLHAAARRRRPTGKEWCVDEILDHLAVTAERYAERVPRVIEKARAAGPRRTPAPRHTWMGNLLIKALKPGSKKMPAPAAFRPRNAPDGDSRAHDALGRFKAGNALLREWIDSAASIESSRAKLSSPALALIRLNVDDALTTLVMHSERHLGQIERTAKALEQH